MRCGVVGVGRAGAGWGGAGWGGGKVICGLGGTTKLQQSCSV